MTDDDSRHRPVMPNDRHRHSAGEEALVGNPVAVARERLQD